MSEYQYYEFQALDRPLIRYSEMVRQFVQDHGSITPEECRELLGLGESQSARVEVSNF